MVRIESCFDPSESVFKISGGSGSGSGGGGGYCSRRSYRTRMAARRVVGDTTLLPNASKCSAKRATLKLLLKRFISGNCACTSLSASSTCVSRAGGAKDAEVFGEIESKIVGDCFVDEIVPLRQRTRAEIERMLAQTKSHKAYRAECYRRYSLTERIEDLRVSSDC